MRRARLRSIYCDADDWDRIARRAGEAGMSVSGFLMACGLADAEETPGEGVAGLVLTEDEQRTLMQELERMDRGIQALEKPIPGLLGMNTIEALQVVVRMLHHRG